MKLPSWQHTCLECHKPRSQVKLKRVNTNKLHYKQILGNRFHVCERKILGYVSEYWIFKNHQIKSCISRAL